MGEYIDRAITGKTDDRPAFQRMIADAPKHGFERVLVWKFDRFARNRYDSVIYKQQLKRHGIRVISAMENIGEGDESILMEAMLEAYAEYYSLDLQKKIVRGQRESIAKKQYAGGSVAFGYKLVDKHFVVDEENASIVRSVFQRYASGESMRSIMDDLNARGVHTNRSKMINYSTLDRILSNKTYIGLYSFSGQVIEDMVEPIIDLELFHKVQ